MNYDVNKNYYFNPLEELFGIPFEGESHKNNLMRTDIEENDNSVLMSIELPDVKKEDIKVSLNGGYLNIEAVRKNNTNEKDKNGKVIHKERYFGSLSRSYYVGDEVKDEDITAKLDNGVLMLDIKKPVEETKKDEKKFISIQ
jgi:HSP20 family protein